MKIRDIKDTEHLYMGYQIKGRTYTTSGGYVLGGRHYKDGGQKRHYIVVKDGIQYGARGLYHTLKEAKELVDIIVVQLDRLKEYKVGGITKEYLIELKVFPHIFIENNYDKV